MHHRPVSRLFPTRDHVILCLILTIGVVLRLWHLGWGLPELYEEATPLTMAWKFWNVGHPGFQFNPHFFHYPAFTFYFQFVVQLVHYAVGYVVGAYSSLSAFEAAISSRVLIARIVSGLFDSGTIVVLYFLARRVAGISVALIAAALLAISPLHVEQSHTINVDVPLTFFATLAVLFLYRLFLQPEMKWYLLAGITIGLAAASKYTGALLLVALLVAHLMQSTSIANAVWSLTSRRLIVAIIASIVVFFTFNPYILLDFAKFKHDFSYEEFHMAEGHLGIDSSQSTIGYYLLHSLPHILGIVFLLVVVASTVAMVAGRKKSDLLLIVFPVTVAVVIGSWEMRADRYILPIVPSLILIGSIGLVRAWNWGAKYLTSHRLNGLADSAIFRSGAVVVTGALVTYPMFSNNINYHHLLSLPDTRAIAKEWIEHHEPAGAAIATGPFGIVSPTDVYTTVEIPFTPTGAENLAPFYDTRWYEDLDLLIASDYDYARFANEPKKYRAILPYYDSLRERWKLVYHIEPGNQYAGPTLWLYKPPIETANDTFSNDVLQKLKVLEDTSFVLNFVERLAYAHFAKGRLGKSEQLLLAAIKLAPNNTRVLREFAWTEYKLDRYRSALLVINHSLELDPAQPEMLALRGSILLRSGQFTDAESNLTRALAMNNRIEFAYLDLELLYRHLNERSKQIDILNRYLRILPQESETARVTRERIQQLRQSM